MKKVSTIVLVLIMGLGSAYADEKVDIVNDVINPFFKDAQISMARHSSHPIIGVSSNSELSIRTLKVHDNRETPSAYKYGENELFAYGNDNVRKKSFMESVWERGDIARRKAKKRLQAAINGISKIKRKITEPKLAEANTGNQAPESTLSLAQNNLDKFVAYAPLTPTQLITFIANNKKDNKVTWVEMELLEHHPEVAKKVFPIALYARKIVKKYFEGAPMYFGDADAFRHSFWNAMMVKYINKDYARIEATAREIWEHGDRFDESDNDQMMDMFNNNIGRELGAKYAHLSDDEIALKLIKEIKNGNLFMLKDGQKDGPLVKSNLYSIDIIGL